LNAFLTTDNAVLVTFFTAREGAAVVRVWVGRTITVFALFLFCFSLFFLFLFLFCFWVGFFFWATGALALVPGAVGAAVFASKVILIIFYSLVYMGSPDQGDYSSPLAIPV
jgi:hypothetical protein